MLRSARLPCCGSTRPSSFFSHRAPTLQRQMSTRQAERLRRSPAAEAKKRAEMAGGSAQPKAPGSTKRLSSGAARSSEARRTTSSTAKPAAAAPAATSAGTSKPPMRGRFNRLVVERGFFFTVYLYVLGESITLSLAYALHTHRLGVGDTGSWLAALHFPVDRFLNVGPAVYGLQLSPRLLLNYVAANLCTYPLLPLQLRFCAATAPVLQVPFAWMGRLARRPAVAVPKAPAAQP